MDLYILADSIFPIFEKKSFNYSHIIL